MYLFCIFKTIVSHTAFWIAQCTRQSRPASISEVAWASVPTEAKTAIITALTAAEQRANAAEAQVVAANEETTAARSELADLKAELAAATHRQTGPATSAAAQKKVGLESGRLDDEETWHQPPNLDEANSASGLVLFLLL